MPYSNDSYTKMLLHFNESAVKDECGNTWTTTGSVALNNDGVFGKCASFTPDCRIKHSTPITLGSSDFTIDFWANVSSTQSSAGSVGTIFTFDNNKFSYNLLNISGNWYFAPRYAPGDGETYGVRLTDVTFDAWHHYAFVYSNGTMKIYVDGNYCKTQNYTVNSSGTILIGGADFLIDEFRVSVGIARWTENFTPPAEPYVFELYPPKLINLAGLKAAIDLIFDRFSEETAKNINTIETTASDTIVFKCVDGSTAFTLSNNGGSVFGGATSLTGGTAGLVPAPTISDTTKFLCGDGTWQSITGGAGSSSSGEIILPTVASNTEGAIWIA